MAKIKLTKGELKRQRDALRQFERYLPTLVLKKQQLQMEILRWNILLQEKVRLENTKKLAAHVWAGLLADEGLTVAPSRTVQRFVVPEKILRSTKNIAGVDLPVFEQAEFAVPEYDLFSIAPWVDSAIDFLRELVSLREEINTIQSAMEILKKELRVTTQRVNLFEKVKIPEAEEAIRGIKIYIGDQMANAVGRSKVAKRKIEELVAAGEAA